MKVEFKSHVRMKRRNQSRAAQRQWAMCETAEPNKQNEGQTGPLFAYFVCRPCDTTSGCSEKLSLRPREKKTVEKTEPRCQITQGPKVTTLFVFLVWLGFCSPIVNTFTKGFVEI